MSVKLNRIGYDHALQSASYATPDRRWVVYPIRAHTRAGMPAWRLTDTSGRYRCAGSPSRLVPTLSAARILIARIEEAEKSL